MKQTLNNEERNRLHQHVAEIEKRTGAQIVFAVIERSDNYDELPWKAFALGVSIACLVVGAANYLRPEWSSGTDVIIAVVAMLAAGAGLALLAVGVPALARLFLAGQRASVEVRQYAESLFLAHELFATRSRSGILLLISLFERQIIILPDTGLRQIISPDALQIIIDRMSRELASGRIARSLEEGLAELEKIIDAAVSGKSAEAGDNEIAVEIIEEKGA